MEKFRKKAVIVEAIQFLGTKESADTIIEWTKDSKTPAYWGSHYGEVAFRLGEMIVINGDWVVKTDDEFHSCKSYFFKQEYTAEIQSDYISFDKLYELIQKHMDERQDYDSAYFALENLKDDIIHVRNNPEKQ